MTIVGLIPARAGSKRVPGKNTKILAGHPLLAYAIASARASGIFTEVIVSTEDVRTADIAAHYGASTIMRPAIYAQDDSFDIEWVRLVMVQRGEDCFAILRPTSPFRTAETIRRAWAQFQSQVWQDSLRAVEPWHGHHPAKMWRPAGKRIDGIVPIWEGTINMVPWHSCPTQSLPGVFIQNASLEIARTAMMRETGTIAGTRVMPFLTDGLEGLNIDTLEDWRRAEWYAPALPAIKEEPYEKRIEQIG